MSDYINSIEEEGIDLSSILNIVIGKWYWYVASALLAICIGYSIIYFTPKVYNKSTTILIKDSKSGSMGNMAFADMTSLQGLSNSNVENEMLVIKSRTLIQKVVEKLGLHISYSEKKNLRTVELYETTPFKIIESQPGTLMPASFVLTILDSNTYSILLDETEIKGEFNKETLFPFGLATIESYPQVLNYYLKKEINVDISNSKRTAEGLLNAIQTTIVSKGANMVMISVNSSCPGKGVDVLNTLTELYNRETVEDKNSVLQNTDLFIKERLSLIREELGGVDGRIEQYKRTSLSNNAAAEAGIYLQKTNSLEEEISNMEVQSKLIDMLLEFIQKPSSKSELLPFNIGLNNQNLNAQIEVYNENLMKLNRLIGASSERNPIVIDMAVSLEAARNSILHGIKDMKRSIELQQTELSHRNLKTTGRLAASSTNERNLLTIERDQKIKEELYLYLLNKKEENAIAMSMTEANARIIDPAFGSDVPIAPRNMIILIASLLVGLTLPMVYFIAKDLLYTKVRGRSDVSKIVTAPILGEIPTKPLKHANDYIVVRQGSNTQVSEAFRILRTNIGFMNLSENQQVISTTSTQPGEGKTYVSGNIAMALALSGKKVCLVGLDLRRPTMQAEFGLKGRAGVTEFLAGKEKNILSSIHQAKENNNLFILPAGMVPPNPAELLMSKRFEEMVAQLREQFDYVILDNPPMNVVADTGIANRVTDISIYVIRAGVLDRRQLMDIEQIYKEQKLTNMGVVITDVDYERLYYSVGYKGAGKSYGYSTYSAQGKEYYN